MNPSKYAPPKTSERLRPPDWRYQLAREAAANGRVLFPGQASRSTRYLARCLRSEHTRDNHTDRRRLATKYPDLAAALEIYREPSGELAHHIELRTLARFEPPEIAETCGIALNTCNWYQYCFFYITPRIDDAEYILQHAIWPDLQRGPDRQRGRLRCITKLLTYFCGFDVVEQLLPAGRVTRQQPWCSPLTLLHRLGHSMELSLLADLPQVWDASFRGDPKCFAAWLAQLAEQLQQTLTRPLPEHPREREFRRDHRKEHPYDKTY